MPLVPRVAVTLTQCWHRVPGGTATSVVDLIEAMARTGEVDLVGVGPRTNAAPTPAVRSVDIARLSLPLPVLYDAWTVSRRPTIESATGPVDVVHLTVPMAPPVTPAVLVATVHDLFPLTMPEQFTGRGARLMRRGLEQIRSRAGIVAVPSTVVAEDCERHGFPVERLRVVPWGAPSIEPAQVSDAEIARVRRQYGLGGPFVLFVGTVEPRKGLATLADAVTRLDRSDLTLAIAGPDGWGTDLDAIVAGVASPVARLGFVPDADLPALERAADVFCYPSVAEGFGLPVLEAMAAGAAVVTTEATSMAEIAGDSARLVPAGDPRALAATLRSVIDDADRCEPMRRRAVERAGRHTWGRAARQMVGIYHDAIESAGVGAPS